MTDENMKRDVQQVIVIVIMKDYEGYFQCKNYYLDAR